MMRTAKRLLDGKEFVIDRYRRIRDLDNGLDPAERALWIVIFALLLVVIFGKPGQ